jgi:hypothetical protein
MMEVFRREVTCAVSEGRGVDYRIIWRPTLVRIILFIDRSLRQAVNERVSP